MRCSATQTRLIFKPTAEPHKHGWRSIRARENLHQHSQIIFAHFSCFHSDSDPLIILHTYREKVGCCKLGHSRPIVVERTRRALQSRAVCRLRLRHDSKGAIECLRGYLGVKAVVRVLRGRWKHGNLEVSVFVLGAVRILANLMCLNLHFETTLFPHAWVCQTWEGEDPVAWNLLWF